MTVPEKYSYPASFGPGVWFAIHTYAAFATSPDKRRAFIEFIYYLLPMIPDEKSRQFSMNYLDKNKPENMQNVLGEGGERIGLFKWTWLFHNAVNRITVPRKPEYPWASAYEMFLSPTAGVCTSDCGDDPDDPDTTVAPQKNLIEALYTGPALNSKNKYAEPRLFGPGLWFTNHIYAFYATTPQRKKDFLDYIYLILTMIKCQTCQGHATQYLGENPPENMQNITDEYGETGLLKWTWIFHNAVNRRIRKEEFPWSRLVDICLALKETPRHPVSRSHVTYVPTSLTRATLLNLTGRTSSEVSPSITPTNRTFRLTPN